MAKFFYYYVNSLKIGPVTGPQLAALAANGQIDRNTLIEGDSGVQSYASNVGGLVFPPKQEVPQVTPIIDPCNPVVPPVPTAPTVSTVPTVPTAVQTSEANFQAPPEPEPQPVRDSGASCYVENMYVPKRDMAAYARSDYKIAWFKAAIAIIGIMYVLSFGLAFGLPCGFFFGVGGGVMAFILGIVLGGIAWGITYILVIVPYTIHIELLQQIRDK